MEARQAEEARGGVPGAGGTAAVDSNAVGGAAAYRKCSCGCPAMADAGCGLQHLLQRVSACPVCPHPPPAAAGDARRWNGVRTVVQARALLKTVFRSASQHKAQASRAGKEQQQAAAVAAGAAAERQLALPARSGLPCLAGVPACLPADHPYHALYCLPRRPMRPRRRSPSCQKRWSCYASSWTLLSRRSVRRSSGWQVRLGGGGVTGAGV